MFFPNAAKRFGRGLLARFVAPRGTFQLETKTVLAECTASNVQRSFGTYASSFARTPLFPNSVPKEYISHGLAGPMLAGTSGATKLPFGVQAFRGRRHGAKKISKRKKERDGIKKASKRKKESALKDGRLKYWRPVTPGQRFRITVKRDHLWKGPPIRALTKGLRKTGGRNVTGRITCRHIGGGAKRRHRFVDFKRSGKNEYEKEAVVQRLEYDPNRSANIALVKYTHDDHLSYILAAETMKMGDTVISGPEAPIHVGNCLPLKNIPLGQTIHNVELYPLKGGQFARSAGTSSTLIKKDEKSGYATVRMTSGELRLILLKCHATIGMVSNRVHNKQVIGKAGYNRHRGIRPSVRGVAMNPIDHPHGGGEGKTSGGRISVTPWGKHTKGKRTRNNKRTDAFRVKRRPMNPKRHKNK